MIMLLLLLALGACSAESSSEHLSAAPFALPVPPPPNVVLIVLDDFGWPEVPLMPSLAAFADGGVTFTRAYSWPTCSPTRIAYRFGRYPRREGAGDLSFNAHNQTQDRLRLSLFSMGELFGPYGTSMLDGKWHCGRAPLNSEMDQVPSGPYCQGYQWRAGSPSVLNAGAGSAGYYQWNRVQAGDMFISTQYATDAQVEEFTNWWTGTAGFKFCELSFSAPHGPYDPPPGFTSQPTVRANYEQILAHLDGALADVLAAIGPDAIVCITSDNGTPDDARPVGSLAGIWKGSVAEGGVRVPLFIAGPGIMQGTTSDRLVSLVDLGATLAELLSIPTPGGFEDSLSFADELGMWPGAPARTFVFTERYEVLLSPPSAPQPVGYDAQAIIEVSWKLTRINGADAFYFISSPGSEQPLTPSQAVQDRLLAELASLPPRAP